MYVLKCVTINSLLLYTDISRDSSAYVMNKWPTTLKATSSDYITMLVPGSSKTMHLSNHQLVNLAIVLWYYKWCIWTAFHLLLDVGIAERHDCCGCCCKRILNSTDWKRLSRGDGKTSQWQMDFRNICEKPTNLKTHKKNIMKARPWQSRENRLEGSADSQSMMTHASHDVCFLSGSQSDLSARLGFLLRFMWYLRLF